MSKKAKSLRVGTSWKYRNLYWRKTRAGKRVIYYEREFKGKRLRFSTKTTDREEAAAVRDLYEQRRGLAEGVLLNRPEEAPRFEDFAKRYLAEDISGLAHTTQRDREGHLRPDGPVMPLLGALRLDEITPSKLREWWGAAVVERKRSTKTGRNYLDAIAGVMAYAVDLGILAHSPLPRFRESLRRKVRTQRGRAEASVKADPIESPEEIDRVVEEARAESRAAHLLVLLCLDGGLRLGETLALRWGHVGWGKNEDDTRRHLRIERSRSRGGPEGPPKSGRARNVALSRRLRDTLEVEYARRFKPGPEQHILPEVDADQFRRRPWRRICERAKVGHRAIKDLRDTFASHLLMATGQLGYVSRQLGHADVAVTAKHYARWCGEEYREPMVLESGEVPADLLARLAGEASEKMMTAVS